MGVGEEEKDAREWRWRERRIERRGRGEKKVEGQ